MRNDDKLMMNVVSSNEGPVPIEQLNHSLSLGVNPDITDFVSDHPDQMIGVFITQDAIPRSYPAEE
jgi:hypothetical protein